jgi:excisionase family DNA binding protein
VGHKAKHRNVRFRRCLHFSPGTADDTQHSKRLLTVDQLADVWQVRSRSIRRMIAKKEIAVIRIGRAVRIHPDVT